MAGSTKRTPRQKRQAMARKLAKKLPEKVKGGETIVSDREIRQAIRLLEK